MGLQRVDMMSDCHSHFHRQKYLNDSGLKCSCAGDDPERCYEEGGGRGVHVWERMYTRGGFMSMYGKTNTVL